jgi:hypothetical protein
VASEQDPPAESGPPDDEDSGSSEHHSGDEDSGSSERHSGDEDSGSSEHHSEAPEETPVDDEPSPSGGSVRFQDPATTKPRPLTVAEARARDKAVRKQKEAEEARLAAEAKRQLRNRRLIGSAAAVGVVGVIVALQHSSHNVNAQCVQDDSDGRPVIVPDYYCTGNTTGYNGFFFYGGHSYRYYYGSSGSIGSTPIGGTVVAPKGATITTGSGTTIQRGGLGSRLFGGSGS